MASSYKKELSSMEVFLSFHRVYLKQEAGVGNSISSFVRCLSRSHFLTYF